MFIRSKSNPILKPDKKLSWQSRKVYNPGAIYENKKYHLFYRAVGDDWISRIGYAFSSDGEKFISELQPRLLPQGDLETRGIEDPRITKIKNSYYLTYTAYNGDCARLSLTTSNDLKNWRKHGPMLKNWNFLKAGGFIVKWDKARNQYPVRSQWSKAGGIFPELIDNKYWMIFGDSNLWLAQSKDGKEWQPIEKPFLKPRKKYFDSVHLEMGPPPLKTGKGWLVIYHGVDEKIVYRLGYLFLDLTNPNKILYRSAKPIFEPSASYELEGSVDITGDNKPKVIFCCGAVIVNNILRIYYGAGDSYVAVASAHYGKLLKKYLNIKIKNS